MTKYVGNLNSSYPYSAIVYIEATFFKTGKTYTGSGVVVGENDVLTASHVIYSASDGGVADLITVYPGKDGWSEPFGSYTYDLVNYFEVGNDGDGFLSQYESQYDLALLGFSEDLGNLTGWFGLDPNAGSGFYHLTGYPGVYSDHTGQRLTDDYGYVFASPYSSVFDYSALEINPGSSGGPLWYENDTGAYVIGIGSTSGWAADIWLNYSTIIDWIKGNDYLMDTAVSDDEGIETETDEDWFTVTLEAGTTYLIELKGADTQNGALTDAFILGIYSSDKNGSSLVSNTSNKSGGVGLNSRVLMAN